MTLTPRPYQIEGRDFLAGKRIGLLADEMRVGKTGTDILAVKKVEGEDNLVLCPAIAAPMWRQRFPDWWPGCPRPTVMSFEKGLISRDEILGQTWDTVTVDECQFAGNPDAQRTKLIYGKGGLVWKCGNLWALSGTPAPKHAGSLWPILRAAGIVGMSYQDFIFHYCRVDPLSLRPIGTKEHLIPELRALWQQIGLRRTRKQVAPEMPEIAFDFLQVDVEKKVDLASVGTLSDEALLAGMEKHADIDRDDRIAVAMAKAVPLIEEVGFALENGLLKQTVIFGWHLEPLRKVTSCLKALGFKVEMLYGGCTERQKIEIQERFALGLLDAVAGQIRACGTAIDLSAASHGYFLELDWLPGSNVQAANRLVAVGKGEPVTIDVVTMPGTVDDRVQRVLLRRARELDALML